MARVIDLIENNISDIRLLVKAGKIPLRLMNDYDIYLLYQSISYEKGEMMKYKIIATRFKISVDTVRMAIKGMKAIV